MSTPMSKEELRSFLAGFIRYLSKFLPRLADVETSQRTQKKEALFHWDKLQVKFQQLKICVAEFPS